MFSQVVMSSKWGFTKWERDEYQKRRADGSLQPDGVNVKYLPDHGPLDVWMKKIAR